VAVGRLPDCAAGWLGRRLGDVAALSLRRRRRLALDNLRRALPEVSPAARQRLYRRSCQHLGRVFVELCALLSRPTDRLLARVSLEGREHLDRVMAAHGRALALTAHLGNWELLSIAHRLTPYPLAVVVRPLDSPWLNTLAERLRRKAGVELIDKRDALRPVLAALARGGVVGILLDQNASRREGVFVPFFGRPASTSRSVALLAIRTGTPVIPIFARREPDGRHRVIIRPPLAPPATNDREEAVVELTARCTAVIEAAIREAPDQWLWMHGRWRTRPADRRDDRDAGHAEEREPGFGR
jgi:Kdo2-lipid IVA lauroyltransferase/acyltransferase